MGVWNVTYFQVIPDLIGGPIAKPVIPDLIGNPDAGIDTSLKPLQAWHEGASEDKQAPKAQDNSSTTTD